MSGETKPTLSTTGGVDRRQFLTAAGAALGGLGLLGLSACGGSSGAFQQGQKNQQAVTHLDEIISPAPFHIAQQEGFFKQAELNLQSISFPGGADVIRAIQTKMPFGLGATIASMIAFNKGFPDVRVVGGMFNSSEVVFMVPSDSPIEKPEDLDGKKIGVSEPGSNTTYFGNLLIDRYKLEGVKITYVGGPSDAITAAQKGVVDVGWSSPPFSTQLVDEGKARVLIDTRKLEPHWATVVLVSKQGVIDKDKKTLDAWVGALGKAVDLIHGDVERAGAAWAKGIGIKPKIATKALEDYREAFTLHLDPRTLDSALRAGKSLDQLSGKVNFDTLVSDQTANL